MDEAESMGTPRTIDPRTEVGTLPIEPPRRQPTVAIRELFWQNVIREMLTSLSILSLQHSSRVAAGKLSPTPTIIDTPTGQITQDGPADEEAGLALFDGRLAVITTQGTRVPIADVHPMFACGIASAGPSRSLSTSVECSVFQIRTPPGEVYTLPLSEIRGFHSLSPELVEELQSAAEQQIREANGDESETDQPFGFAAFTSLSQEDRSPDQGPIDRS